ncbi:S53 family peptidase [Petropleomorpha daqingensis]|uniref:Kumamolisin n=1 Tax=Petropleomorpha daqingensis TaxID=2026353 RepID=A0A853CG28_9ACTN|nr:S53 family peptidase [Petropleomorpha daqingensis]NYJ05522.1 kumamolisin [Petropleomorpha daqingensis]
MTSSERPPLPGSDRYAARGVRATGVPDPAAPVDITVVLRRGQPLPALGAAPDDVATAVQALESEGLEVLAVDVPSRRIQARGDVAMLERVFGTSLSQVQSPDPVTGRPVPHRQRTGELVLPPSLAGVVIAVLGLDDRPQARVRFRPAAGPTTSFTPLDLGRVYRFPAGTDGSGQMLAILELGGGYRQADLDAYWAQIGLADPPTVTAVGVDGGANAPEGDPNGADGEVLLDIEVAGGLAPGADLVVYFAPNTDRGFLDALSDAVHARPTPTVVSISWGQSEDEWTGQARTAMDEALADAAALGVTVCVAAGDDGSRDNATDAGAHVDFPAASPHALACGGTTLQADATSGTVHSEVVWFHGVGQGGTGGGVSDVFAVPSWQAAAGVPGDADTGRPGRGVPDVAGDADPSTGYQVRVDGTDVVYGGTSAVAPLWSALVCRLAEALGRSPGFLPPVLYGGVTAGRPAPGFRDITSGSNGAYTARPGWDACTGLGVPDGEALLARLRG